MTPEIVINSTEKSSTTDDIHAKYKLYGWKRFRIGGILSRPVFAYVILCICNFIQNFSVNGANNAVISTLERVFYMDSVQSGLFLALYDVATVFSSPIVGYLGSRHSSPIFFSLNMIIVGIGNMLIASSNFVNRDRLFNINPEFLQYLSTYSNNLFQCSRDPSNEFNITDVACLKQERITSASTNAKFLLYFGNFVNGIGSVALFTIGIAYIERIFPRHKAAYCQGIYFAVGTLGGALGIVASGRFLMIYTKLTPRKRLPSWLTPSHPLWIGCWWLPYIVYGSLCLVIGLFVSGLPNYEKPGTKHPTHQTSSTPKNDNTNLSINRQESPTSISYVSSCPPTPALIRESSETDGDVKKALDNPPSSAKLDNSEYRLSNRKFRQLAPLEHKPSTNSLLTVGNTSEGCINHAYSSDTPYNPPVTSSTTSDSLQSSPSVSMSAPSTNESLPSQTTRESIKHMWSVIVELMKNTRYVFIIIANLFEGILIKGFVPFITKYFEYQHQLDTSTATLLTGAIALIAVVVACPIGAYFMNKLSWTPMQCARVCGIVFTVSSFLFLFLTLSCPELKFEYTPCTKANSQCCRNVYYPVCTDTNPRQMYLSPCHFGCTSQNISLDNDSTYYSSCHCAQDSAVKVTETACRFRRIPCVAIFALTMTGATFVVFFTAFIQVPMLQPLLYSVPLQHQSMALGIRQTIVRVLGQTTGPLLFGFAFDESCLFWLTDCFGRRTCKIYNNRRMGISMALTGFGTRIISGIACMIVFFNWKWKHSNQTISPPATVGNSSTINPTDEKENGSAAKL